MRLSNLHNARTFEGQYTYAIVSDVGPTRCNIDKLVTSDGTALDVSREQDVGLHRVMFVPDVALVRVGDRAWHRDDRIQGSGR